MKSTFDWSENLNSYLHNCYGNPLKVTRLGGLSKSQVWRVDFVDNIIVVKYQVGKREINFYQKIAPRLQQAELALPKIEQLWAQEPETWLIMEYLPNALPQSRWAADSQQIAYLKKLHSFTQTDFPDFPDYFQPIWPDLMTEQALSVLPIDVANEVGPKLKSLQEKSQLLFEPQTAISGDPNPLNWAINQANQLVLFDWERFGFGTPAIDLAITAPGLGDANLFERIARIYLNSDDEQAIKTLTQQITLAKVWVVTEFLSFQAQKTIDQPATIAVIASKLPSLLKLV